MLASVGASQAPLAAAPFKLPFEVPASVGGARLRDSAFVGEAISYRYEGRRVTGLDVYIWPLETTAVDATIRDSLLQVQAASFEAAAPLGVERGWYDDYRIAFQSKHPVDLDGDSLPGYAVALVFSRQGRQFTSFFYIYAVQGMYFKIRLTVPAENWDSNPALDLPAELVRAVARKR